MDIFAIYYTYDTVYKKNNGIRNWYARWDKYKSDWGEAGLGTPTGLPFYFFSFA